MASAELIHLGMDTSMNTIVVGVLRPGEEIPVVARVVNDEESVRRLIGRFGDRRMLSACYEAGPGGFELYRLLSSMGVACEVVAPSSVPKGSSDRVKTDKRDAIGVGPVAPGWGADRGPGADTGAGGGAGPGSGPGDVLDDRKRMQQRLNAVLMRHGRIWRGGSTWTPAHRAWIGRQVFDEPALKGVVATYRGGLAAREAELAAVEAELVRWAAWPPSATAVARLGAFRGIAQLTGMTPAAEVVDWRRFATARAFMGFCGLIPSEYSSGGRDRRGQITKAAPVGVRTALIEAAWAYQHRPGTGVTLSRRQAGASAQTLARSWTAQQRPHAKYQKMTRRGKPPGVAVVALAREPAGFVWAETTS